MDASELVQEPTWVQERLAGAWRADQAGALSGLGPVLPDLVKIEGQREPNSNHRQQAHPGIHPGIGRVEHRPVGVDLAGVNPEEREDQRDWYRHAADKADRDRPPQPPALVCPAFGALDRESSARIVASSRRSI